MIEGVLVMFVEGSEGSAKPGACHDSKVKGLHSLQFSSIALVQSNLNPCADAVAEYG